MPELPEVETTLRGILPHIVGQKIVAIIIRCPRLRWDIPNELQELLQEQLVRRLWRRGKYILFEFDTGTLILHLGMSGRICILHNQVAAKKHDHVDICFANHICMRFTDPRRFGALLWSDEDVQQHPLLINMGPEPLTQAFNGKYLWQRAQHRKMPVKSYIMDSKIVAGVGNIYATEALFIAGVRPQKPAGKVSLAQYLELAKAIKTVLRRAIKKGGTTLKDFSRSDGSPGYFSIELKVYGREGEPCPQCQTHLKCIKIGQRSSVFCPKCQK